MGRCIAMSTRARVSALVLLGAAAMGAALTPAQTRAPSIPMQGAGAGSNDAVLPFPAAKTGGNYMHTFYFPPGLSATPWWPDWSPDGRWIAVSMEGSIWKVDPATGAAFELTYNGRYHSSPDWSPDGKSIIYTVEENLKAIQLEILSVDTRETYALTSGEHIYTDPELSPDGTHVVSVQTAPLGDFIVYLRPV